MTIAARYEFTPGPADHLAFGVGPTNTAADAAISPAVTVRILDQHGNLVPSSAEVTVAIGTNPTAGRSQARARWWPSTVSRRSATSRSTRPAPATRLRSRAAAWSARQARPSTSVSGELDHIVISPATATIVAGGTQAYSAEGFDALANSLGDVTGATRSSRSPAVAPAPLAVCTSDVAGDHTVPGSPGRSPTPRSSR